MSKLCNGLGFKAELINIILFALSLALVLLGRPLDAITTVAVISFNIVVSLVQEIRAKRSLDRIALLSRPTATVIRAGKEQTVDPNALVVGDLLVARPGDQIVVDGRLVGKGWIDVDESLLTGESDLVRKSTGDPLSSGSFCVNGSAVYEAVQVGAQSTAYKLTAGARIFRRVLTPLQQQVTTTIRILLVLACYLGLALLIITTIVQTLLVETLQMSVVIAGLIPNGLLLAIAVAYALAAMRLASLPRSAASVRFARSESTVLPSPSRATTVAFPTRPLPFGLGSSSGSGSNSCSAGGTGRPLISDGEETHP